MRRALLVYNPNSGMRRHKTRLPAILDALREGGIAAEPSATFGPGHATTLAREAAKAGFEIVLGYGGDGTVRETAEGLYGTQAALGVLPGGTTNVVARAFSLSTNPVEAARRLCRAPARPIDVGLCGGHPFLMQASSGPEAYAMARFSTTLKANLGFPGAALSVIGSILRYRYPEIVVRADDEPLRGFSALVFNISEIAGPYRGIPDGRFDDRQLELMLFTGRGLAAVAGFCLDLYRGTHVRRRDVLIRPVKRVVFEGPPGAFVQLDGDALPLSHPIEITLAPERLQALVP